jgi:hypothetical protein
VVLQRLSHGSSTGIGLVSAARQEEYTRGGVGCGCGSVAALTAMIATAPAQIKISPAVAAGHVRRLTGRR